MKNELLKQLSEEVCDIPDTNDSYYIGYNNGLSMAKAIAIRLGAVPVVRCRDCKHYSQNPWNEEELLCKLWTDWLSTAPNDFCSYGERRNGDE